MKPVLERLPIESEESFVVKYFDYNYYPTPWHFHPEYELVLVTESTGQRFIGDAVQNFKENDLALIGPNLPHLYKNGREYYQPKSTRRARSIVVHFTPDSFGSGFLSLPESKTIARLLTKSARGIDVFGKTNKLVGLHLKKLVESKGFNRVLILLEILHLLAESHDWKYISNEPVKGVNDLESARINKVFDFVLQNFHRTITIEEIASMTNMAPNSFSRFYRQRTRKTFTAFVNEVRLGHAAKLLIENTTGVAEICYACGYNNLSNFNRQFKQLYGTNPLTFRNKYWQK